jgi:hypothetical protein
MKTLLNLFLRLLMLVWVISAVAILPLALIGAVLMNAKIFLSAWLCAIILLAVPVMSHIVTRRVRL